MNQSLLATVTAALLVWEALLLIPMVPGKLIDTRDFSRFRGGSTTASTCI